MFHHRSWSAGHTQLFRDPLEALGLWTAFTRAFPETLALCLMPDHVHLVLPHADEARKLAQAESAYARWRNHRRRTRGRVFAPHPPAEPIPEKRHSRLIRYVLLNPCRARLVSDPLAWPWSTHRDRVGLAIAPVGPVEMSPARFHRYVSSDPTTAIGGTDLPKPGFGDHTLEDVLRGVRSVARCAEVGLQQRGRPRSLALRSAWILGARDVGALSEALAMSETRIYELVRDLPALGSRLADPALAACVAVVGDERFHGIATPLPRGERSHPESRFPRA